jgi:hypothetical protein
MQLQSTALHIQLPDRRDNLHTCLYLDLHSVPLHNRHRSQPDNRSVFHPLDLLSNRRYILQDSHLLNQVDSRLCNRLYNLQIDLYPNLLVNRALLLLRNQQVNHLNNLHSDLHVVHLADRV